MCQYVSIKHAVVYLFCTNPDWTTEEIYAHLGEIGMQPSLHTVTSIIGDYKRTVREVIRAQDELEEPKPKPKQKRYKARTWYPDG